MPKIEINTAAEICKRNSVEPEKLRAIIEEMNALLKSDDEKAPAQKKQFVILVSDPYGRFPKDDFAGWVLQIPDSESSATTEDRIRRAVYEFNTTKKGRLLPAKTVGEALENVPAKHFKETECWVKTKTPVLVLRTDNRIPLDEAAMREDRAEGGDEE